MSLWGRAWAVGTAIPVVGVTLYGVVGVRALPGHCDMQDRQNALGDVHTRCSCSMAPALHCGDVVLARRKWTFGAFRPRPGDVVELTSPFDPYVTGVARLLAQEDGFVEDRNHTVVRVPKARVWVERDNDASPAFRGVYSGAGSGMSDKPVPRVPRELVASSDSCDFGHLPAPMLRGQVVAVLWPPSRIGLVASKYPAGRRRFDIPGGHILGRAGDS